MVPVKLQPFYSFRHNIKNHVSLSLFQPQFQVAFQLRSRKSAAQTASSKSELQNTVKSLDSLLGSADEQTIAPSIGSGAEVTGPATSQGATIQKSSVTKAAGIAPPRVRPLLSFAIYYLHILLYGAYLQALWAEGVEEADSFLSLLVNDHVAAASGEWWRLLTASTVHSGPAQLFCTLVAFLTLSCELEAVLGYKKVTERQLCRYGMFLAIYYLSVVSGSLSEALLLDSTDVTWGPGAAVAGMVGALVAHEASNWDLQLRISEASAALRSRWSGKLSGSMDSMSSMDGSIWSSPDTSGKTDSNLDASVSSLDSMDAEDIRKQSRQKRVLSKVEVNDIPLAFVLTKEQRAVVNVLAAGLVGFQTLGESMELAGHTSWVGLLAGLFCGTLIASFAGPKYAVQTVQESTQQTSGDNNMDSNVVAGGLGQPVVKLVDERPGLQKLFVITGYASVLTLGTVAWLQANQGL